MSFRSLRFGVGGVLLSPTVSGFLAVYAGDVVATGAGIFSMSA